jgi:hypothetical protein
MVEFLFPLFQMSIENTMSFLSNRIIDRSAMSAVIGEFIGILGINGDIEHILAVYTELHI